MLSKIWDSDMKTEKNIFVAFGLSLAFFIIEFLGAMWTNSMAIMSDSVHRFSDVVSVGLAGWLEKKSKQRPDSGHSYGYSRYSVLGGVITTVILVVGSSVVIFETLGRMAEPEEVNYHGMILLAIIGIVVNSIATYVTHDGKSLNQRSINLHMLGDVLSWVIVLIGAIVMNFTDIKIIDSIMSIAVATFILIRALKNGKEILGIFLEVTPRGVDVDRLKKEIEALDGVRDVKQLRVRSIDGYKNEATVRVVVNKYRSGLVQQVKKILVEEKVRQANVEVEVGVVE